MWAHIYKLQTLFESLTIGFNSCSIPTSKFKVIREKNQFIHIQIESLFFFLLFITAVIIKI